MKIIELTNSNGHKFLYDFDSGWEIYSRNDQPAHWTNHREARNLDATETYADIKARLLPEVKQ